MTESLKHQRTLRNILFLLFALPGLSFASWVARTPAVRDTLNVSTAEMGMIIFALSIGSLTGLLTAGSVIARQGARLVIVISSLMIVIGFVVIGIGASIQVMSIVMTGLLLFGCGFGAAEVGLNMEGSAVEKALNKVLLPAFHGFFSVGTLAGAVIGIGAEAIELPIIIHFSILALFITVILLSCFRFLPEVTGKETIQASSQKGTGVKMQLKVWTEKRTLLIGVMVLGMAFAEGSANDWLPLIMVDGHGVNALTGSLIYGLFVTAMTLGRFSGGWVLNRYGRVRVLTGCAVSAILGLILVIWGQHYILAAIGVLLWGLGASLGFPVGLSAAGDEPEGAAARVGAVATSGYIASLVGPPFLGFLGEHFGLLNAMIAVMIGVIISGSLTRAAKPIQVHIKKPSH
ncbi:MFS transporter [Paenibacillus sp. ACRRY]|uniref:MFS transporter n=1 Tax=Paenibacillus sp. ACRRY TaxID=2918208 RepID=UPI001EF60F81|nr:MFS transporter [Paenibacillus sp. ACRRY]MCG7381316.1 MFS transporter [Paenibacillus sp. ACRRY]